MLSLKQRELLIRESGKTEKKTRTRFINIGVARVVLCFSCTEHEAKQGF